MPDPLDHAKQLARERYGRVSPFRLGLVANDAGLTECPYETGKSRELYVEGMLRAWIWRCKREEREKVK